MFLEKVKAAGLAHVSYVIGDGNEAAVIDPRRDVDVYLDIARKQGARITRVFETHRNEDYAIGSLNLQRIAGADIFHGAGGVDFAYGEEVKEGATCELGDVKLEVLSTPGHTDESISVAFYDKSFSGDTALGVFTGDAMFVGDVGRTDFFPDRAEEVAGLLYDSLFGKLIPLGDQTLIYPAHGAGSVCGSNMADRDFSTIGYERQHSMPLQHTDRRDFIKLKVSEQHFYSPWFKRMEEWNKMGAPPMDRLPEPRALNATELSKARDGNITILDTRSVEAFAAAHIPGSYNIPLSMISAFAGWFLPYDQPIGLVVKDPAEVEEAVRHLIWIGYDDVVAFLADGIEAWQTAGHEYGTIEPVHVRDLVDDIKRKGTVILDVRSPEEFAEGHLEGAINLYVGHVDQKIDEIPRDGSITTFCGSGRRAGVAASILKQRGFERVRNCLGSMSACESVGCSVVTEGE
ncbi:MAG: MBL fold metallo-hydrolase [Armatimonadia bacterium]|nr:MBL fold metallo-hydrolase [Armatimonadia bacterium]